MPNVNLGVAGLILMVAGGAVIAHARATAPRKERVVERPARSPATRRCPRTSSRRSSARRRRD